jgi:exopolysaccharide production protein ExoQ
MPPKLALLMCSVFVLALLWVERKQSPRVSPALWLPTIWMLCIASKPLGVWLGMPAEDAETGSPLDRVFLSGLLCLGLIILLMRLPAVIKVLQEHVWLLLLIGYMLLSVLWSDIPFVSLKRWTRELLALIMAFLVLSERQPRAALESILRKTVYILIPFSLLLIKYFPDEYGASYNRWTGTTMWVGVTLQKNSLGRLCIIATFFLIWALFKDGKLLTGLEGKYRKLADGLVLCLALWLLKGPPGVYPATAIAALAAGLGAYSALLWMKKRNRFPGAGVVAGVILLGIAYGAVTPFVGGSSVGSLSSAFGRDTTLTGRTDIWVGLTQAAREHPLLGHGFGSFWTTEHQEAYTIDEAHNGYLEVFLELGLIGVLLLSLFFVACGLRGRRLLAYDFDLASLLLCFVVMAVVHNVAESSLHRFSGQLMATLLFVSVAAPGRRSLMRARTAQQRSGPAQAWQPRSRQAMQ